MDIRIVKTKKKLTNSLLALIREKRLQDITVLELCKKAKINRTTFYKYYKDVEDLVLKIESSLISELEKEIPNIKRNYLLTYTSTIIENIYVHKDVYAILLGKNGDKTLLRRVLKSVYKESKEEWRKLLKKTTEEDLDKIYNFIVDGSIGIINNWINNKCSDDPKLIATFINKICMSGLSSFI